MIAAFLHVHKGHDVALYLEGDEVTDRVEPRSPLDASNMTTFEFGNTGFVMAIYDVSCKKCQVSFRNRTGAVASNSQQDAVFDTQSDPVVPRPSTGRRRNELS